MDKYCKKCDTTKPVSEFHKNAARKDGLTLYCRQCNNRSGKEWHEKNPDYKKEWRKNNPDKCKEYAERKKPRTYGMTIEDYNSLLDQQNNRCAICGGKNKSGYSLYVDHDHSCCKGKESCGECVRQLLCLHCNMMLGHAKDNIETLKAAQNYLERHSRPKKLAKILD